MTRTGLLTSAYAVATCLSILVFAGCEITDSGDSSDSNSLVIGTNYEVTGALSDVGQEAKNATDMYVDILNTAGGFEVDGQTYTLEIASADNEGTATGGANAATDLIVDEKVLAMIGPNPSNSAIAAGEVADDMETLMISPWSTNPNTTLGRSWVFRVPFLDTFQGPVLADFASQQFSATKACVLYDEDNDYPTGLASSFTTAWIGLHGAASISSSQTFHTGATDFTAQLTAIRDSDCEFVFLPQYAHEVPPIVMQANDVNLDIPILGADAWGGSELLSECGSLCDGYFFSAHYIPNGATGTTKDFIDKYESRFGSTPTDVAALTWDAMQLVTESVAECGQITGNLATDRTCIRDAMASISDFEGITGTISFNTEGDPIKCAVIGEVLNGEFIAYDTVCP